MEKILAHIDANIETSLERLFTLLRIPSISAQPAHREDCLNAANWATGFNPGGAPFTESGQGLVGYSLTADHPELFAVQPAINTAGTLTFTPATNRNGVATVSVSERPAPAARLRANCRWIQLSSNGKPSPPLRRATGNDCQFK